MRSAVTIALAAAVTWAAGPRVAEARCKPDSAARVVQPRAVGSFHEIGMSAPAELIVKQGARESLTVRADRRVLPYLRTTVRNGRLELDLDSDAAGNRLECVNEIVFEVTVVNLSALEVSGAGSVVIDGLRGKQLSLDLGGAASVRMDRAALGGLDLTMSGAVKVSASGQATRQSVRISGTGHYQAERLASQTAVISISGTGHARVMAARELDASISGVGNIEYVGNPRVKQSISGMGSLARVKR